MKTPNRKPISFRLTPEGFETLKRLQRRLGVQQVHVVEESLRTLERVLDLGEAASNTERGYIIPYLGS